ncbi:MAG: ABC transporter permease [Chloroflexota bacterium]|nr:ABC transporter permease [Chloroflexota bacterium]
MIRFLLRRLVLALPILWGVATLVFLLMRVTGDPLEVMYGGSNDPGVLALKEQRRRELGMDRPLPVQYVAFLADAAHLDLGRSVVTRRPVSTMLLERLPTTLELGLAAMAIAMIIAVPIGIISATRRNTWLDDVSMVGALLGVSVPNFWLGLMLMLVFSLYLGWLPASGQGSWQTLVMPAVALGLAYAALQTRLIRSTMLEVLGQDYIRTARAKGLASRAVLIRHGLRNALIPVTTVVGIQIGQIVGGSVIIEQVFGRDGIGSLMIKSIFNRDYPVVQGGVLLLAFAVVAANLLVDLVYVLIDPQIRVDA